MTADSMDSTAATEGSWRAWAFAQTLPWVTDTRAWQRCVATLAIGLVGISTDVNVAPPN